MRVLKEEAQGVELLASEAEIEFARLEDYWALSMELVSLVLDIDAYAASNPHADRDDPEVITLRHRLRDISSRLAEMTVD
jgi:hypothetical protein